LFKSNSSLSGRGGGALLTSLVECQLIENLAKQGGGLSYGTATNTLFLNNSASDNGGGVFDGKITNCTLVGNTSTKYGGGLCYGFAADCLFSNNLAKESGGGIFGDYVMGSGSPRGTATNCTFVKNRSLHSGGGMDRGLAHYCRFDRNIASGYGGGMSSGTANHCVFIRNSAGYGGGGMAGGDSAGVANVCVFVGNTATKYGGAGMDGGLANHCTFTANSVLKQVGGFGGGMVDGSASNCIFKGNWVWDREENIRSVSAHSCCAAELIGGINGCISSDPLLITASHLSATSPCIGAGVTNDLAQTDIDGELWAASPAMGCDEYYSGTHGKPELLLFLSDRFAQNGSFPIRYTVLGSASTVLLDLGDGTILTNQLSALHSWSSTGSFEVVLTAFSADFPEGISVTQRVEIVEPILHVSPDGNDNYDGLSWATAKKTIQNAVNHSEMSACPTILVTNGTYFSQIVVTNALTIRSVNGPLSTIIDGNSSHKCFRLGGVECEIIGFTLQNGVSSTEGGGIYCTDSKPLISNCIFYKNHANSGGGLYWGRVQNSLFVGNSVDSTGGAIARSSAQNCTIINNISKNKGAGIYQGAATNCIIYYNLANMRENNLSETPSYYTCSPELNSSFTGCITNEPLLASSSHLSTNSPCVGAGTAEKSEGTDLDGVAWNTPPSMGCDEFSAETHGDLTLSLSLPSQIAEGANARICSTILGAASCSILETSDGSVVSNRSAWVHAWNAPGIYSIRLTAFNNDHPSGVSITQQISVVSTPLYVSSLTGNDANDGLSWATAKQTIQAAVNIAQVLGQQIWVSNGVYHLSNEISVDKYVRIQGLNGAEKTILDGAGAHRCFYLGIHAPETVLSEMTFTNGHATLYDYGGAGVLAFCDQTTVKDAIFTHNIVTGGGTGGGMRGGHVVNCIFENNSAEYGGGLYDGTALGCSFLENQVTGPVENSPYGGGLAYGDAERCLFSGNRSDVNGAGIAYGTAVYCVFSNNVAVSSGGASYRSQIKNSLVVSNTADYGAGVAFGSAIGSTIVENLITSPYSRDAGVYGSAATNSIIWNNFGATGTSGLSQLWNSCAPFASSGVNGNIAFAPKFVNDAAHNYRLNAGSPCINAGDNVISVGQLDLDENPRIVNNVLDMGAYEFQGGTPADVDADGLPDSWENQYFGNTGAGDPDADPDQDASDNLSEYISGSIPTNSTSFFAITNALPIAGNGFCVNWSPCLAGRMYSIYWAESLSGSFRELSSEIEFPQGSYTDLVHQVESNGFYKVKVELK
jgi:predicted outer membrane repeat protein